LGLAGLGVAAVAAGIVLLIAVVTGKAPPGAALVPGAQAREAPAPTFARPAEQPAAADAVEQRRIPAPELDRGIDWLNTAGPIRIQDLRGKIVLLDFWTLCCINCIHTLPDLARLEKKYPNQLVIIGVHSAKFTNERNSESIRKAILRYEITHPVINDANMGIWRRYGVNSWPTLFLIDPEGYVVWGDTGEGLYDGLDRTIARLIEIHRAKKTLDETPLAFALARAREPGTTPLYFPGKIFADAAGRRLFIADSTHHRIVITDLDGKKIAIAGTGQAGSADGPFDRAGFNDPQGMALQGDTLYVADRKNNLIRSLDLKSGTVSTLAGTGDKGENRRQRGPARQVALNSPWDLSLQGHTLFIAMAGHHQIWSLDLDRGQIGPYAGFGREGGFGGRIQDGPLDEACFAQPSGLANDGKTLYVADSEVSGIRALPMDGSGEVKTIVGEGLFEFADRDGTGAEVRLQHALGVAFHKGKLYVADTYNSKIKEIDPGRQTCVTMFGGKPATIGQEPLFNEPGGLSCAGDKLYVADTNNHRIRVVDLATRKVSTLRLQGVEPPALADSKDRPSFPNATLATLPSSTVPADGDLTLAVELHLAPGFKLNPQSKLSYLVEPLGQAQSPWSEMGKLDEQKTEFPIKVPLARLSGAGGVKLSLVYYECGGSSQGVCRIKSHIWQIPLKVDGASTNRVIHVSGFSGGPEEVKPDLLKP
jgi:thiol-disulfide isomerase/thioredoxin